MDVHTPRKPIAVNQFNSLTHDGRPDENADNDCTESCTCSALDLYGRLRPDGTPYVPDDLHDWAFGQGTVGVQGNSTTVQNMLAHFGGIPSITQAPTEFWNHSTGLMDRIWQSLHDRQAPVFCAVWWIDWKAGFIYDGKHAGANGAILPAIGHWRLCWRLTDSTVYTMDPVYGEYRKESWAAFQSISRKVLVAPTIAPPGATV